MSKKQRKGDVPQDIKDEYFQKGWNDPDNLNYLGTDQHYEKQDDHSCVEQVAFYRKMCVDYKFPDVVIAFFDGLPKDELELDYFINHNMSHRVYMYMTSELIGREINKKKDRLHQERMELERQRILHTIKNNTEYNQRLLEILNDFGMDFQNKYLCAVQMRYRKDNGQFKKYDDAYKYGAKHCTIKGEPVGHWHTLEKAYRNAKDREYLPEQKEQIDPRIAKDLEKQ